MSQPRTGQSRLLKPLLAVAVVVALIAWLAGPTIRRALTQQLFLNQPAPNSEGVYQWLTGLDDPSTAVRALWQRGRIPHRYLAVQFTKNHEGEIARAVAEPLMIEAAQDADLGVRELALGSLARQPHPAFLPLALRQLRDTDPEARRLGLRYLSPLADPALTPRLMALLDDPNLTITALTAAALRKTTGQDFNVRARDTIPTETGQPLEPEKAARLAVGIQAWKTWWQANEAAFTAAHPVPDTLPKVTIAARPAPVVADFALTDVAGETVRLSDFDGKVVWLNFWATWCNGCVSEIPLLNQLQARFGDQLVILGISLDGVPDEHGHGHEPDDAPAHEGTPAAETTPVDHEAAPGAVPASTLAKVKRTVRRRNIQYRVLLDPHYEVGSRFNGGELPTQVLIAPDGHVVRRFIGPRPLPILASMVEEVLSSNAAVAGGKPSAAAAAKTALAKE